MNNSALQSRRFWLVGGLLAAALLIGASWLLVISPKLASASDTQAQTANTELNNSQIVAKNAKLAQEHRHLAVLRNQLAAALVALPPSSALPEFTTEATQTAAATSVKLSDIVIGALTPVAAAVPAAPASPTSTQSATPTASPTTAAPAGAAGAAAAPGDYQIGVTLTSTGSLAHQLAFVDALQHGARRALVTSTLFSAAGTKADALTLTTQLNIFTAPLAPAQLAQLRHLLTAAR